MRAAPEGEGEGEGEGEEEGGVRARHAQSLVVMVLPRVCSERESVCICECAETVFAALAS